MKEAVLLLHYIILEKLNFQTHPYVFSESSIKLMTMMVRKFDDW